MYTDLLKMCGLSDAEIEKNRTRIDTTFRKLELGSKDIRLAEKRLPEQMDMTLAGVRKCMRLWFLELFDLVMAKEEGRKLIYFTAPDVPFEAMEAVRAAAVLNGKDVYVGDPAFLEATVMGIVFDRHDAIVEHGELALPPGNGHCLMSQSKAGGLAKGYIPLPDLEVVGGYYCDQVPEAEDLLAELYGFKTVYLDSCFDADWEQWPDVEPRRVEYLKDRYMRCFAAAEEVIGEKITDEIITQGRKRHMQALIPYIEIRDLLAMDPPPMSVANVVPFFYMFFNPLAEKKDWVDACQTLLKEGKQRAKDGVAIVPKGAPAVLFPLVPNVDTGVAQMIENMGVRIPTMILMHPTKAERSRKKTFTDPLGHIVEGFFSKTWYCLNFAPVKQWLVEMVDQFDLDGVIFVYQAVCRVNACNNNPVMLKKAIQDDTGVPFINIEGDYHCTRTYPIEEWRTRIETFVEVVKEYHARKMAAV